MSLGLTNRYRAMAALFAAVVLVATGCSSTTAVGNSSTASTTGTSSTADTAGSSSTASSPGSSSTASSPGSSSVSDTAGSSSGGSSTGSSSNADINVEQAKADLDAVVNASPVIDVPAITKPIPKNQTINVLECSLSVCIDVGTGVKDAAQALGWSVKIIPSDSTPAGYQAAWDQIAQSPGNGVVNTSPILPYSAISKQTEKANVPIVSSTSPDPVGGHLIAVVSSTKDIALQGATQANWAIQDAGAPVKSVYVYDPSIPALRSALPGYQDAMKKNCPACSVDVLEVSAAQIGPALAQQVVSYLQSHPDTKYISFGLGAFATGVPAAIKLSGLQGRVKLTVRGATPANFADLQTGGLAAAFTAELFEAGWRSVDKIVRALTGDPIGEQYPLGVIRMFTKDKLPADSSTSYSVPDFQQPFKKAWGVS